MGYDYCLKDGCQQEGMKRVELAAVGVNKAADYYTTADELLPPRLPNSAAVDTPDDLPASIDRRTDKSPITVSRQPPTTLGRLREFDAQLDRDLQASYERFERGEITAAEMERECERLTAAFNQVVRGENIRYRSMLRGRRSRTR
jgi:hypothetical protein